MSRWGRCPLCGAHQVMPSGWIRRHSPLVGYRVTPWCPAGGRRDECTCTEFSPQFDPVTFRPYDPECLYHGRSR